MADPSRARGARIILLLVLLFVSWFSFRAAAAGLLFGFGSGQFGALLGTAALGWAGLVTMTLVVLPVLAPGESPLRGQLRVAAGAVSLASIAGLVFAVNRAPTTLFVLIGAVLVLLIGWLYAWYASAHGPDGQSVGAE